MPLSIAEKDLRAVNRTDLIGLTSDVALVMDKDGTILEADVNLGDDQIGDSWVGQRFSDIVTVESKEKVDALLTNRTPNQWRQVNHPKRRSTLDHPVRYLTLPLSKGGRILGIGQNLLPIAEIQQQLVEAQEAAEQDYWRVRQAEARFQVVFESVSEAIFVADADDGRLIETNLAAQSLMKRSTGGIRKTLTNLFHRSAAEAVQRLLEQTRSAGTATTHNLLMRDGETVVEAEASLLRQGNAATIILRLFGEVNEDNNDAASALELLNRLPDAVAFTDKRRRIVWANPLFAELCQLPDATQSIGSELSDWIGRAGVDTNVLYSNLMRSGFVRSFSSQLTGHQGLKTDIEITAVTLDTKSTAAAVGMVIRTARPTGSTERGAPERNLEIEHLVGRLPLKELVKESTEQIERLAINSALAQTSNNRAAAAEMLGISRQSLYFKLRQYGHLDKN